MSQGSLKDALAQICGEKIKNRQEGLAVIRTTFSSDAAISKFDSDNGEAGWSQVFKAIFTAVALEKKASSGKKGTVAAERRLADTANLVRWLTERLVNRLNRKTTKMLLSHLVETMIHGAQLLPSVSLDYLKAIRCILYYHPHLEHLDNEIWMVILRYAFNIILEDHIEMGLEESSAANQEFAPTEEPAESGDDALGESPSLLKRRRREESAPPSRAVGRRAASQRSTSLEQIECAAILAVLLQSLSTPILSPDYPYLPSGILDRLVLILRLFPPDSSLHHDVLSAILNVIQHLKLNRREIMLRFASESLVPLLDLWHARTIEVKERLLAILKLLFPYFHLALQENNELHDMVFDGLSRLWDLLESVPEGRKGGGGLDLNRLRLCVVDGPSSNNSRIFTAKSFCAGWDFDRSQVFAWTMHEIHADCMIEIYRVSDSIGTGGNRARNKRVRLEQPLQALLRSISATSTTSGVKCYRLQTLMFLVDRHWCLIPNDARAEALGMLMQHMSSEDASIQTHTFLCLATVAQRVATSESKEAPNTAIWDNIWTYAMRRIHVPSVSRGASHVASVLLAYSRTLLSSQRILPEIDTIAQDLDVQGPPTLHESTCTLLRLMVETAHKDIRLHRLHLEEKTFSWLSNVWQTTTDRESGLIVLTYDVQDLFSLITVIVGATHCVNLVSKTQLPVNVLTKVAKDEARSAVIRGYLLDAKLDHPEPEGVNADNVVHSPTPAYFQDHLKSIPAMDSMRPASNYERKVSSLIARLLETLVPRFAVTESSNTNPSIQKHRSAIDLAVVALSYETFLTAQGIRPTQHIIQAGCKLISRVVTSLSVAAWTLEEKAFALSGMQPLVQLEEDGFRPWATMAEPGSGTGVRRAALRWVKSKSSSVDPRYVSQQAFQMRIWENPIIRDELKHTLNDLQRTVFALIDHGKVHHSSGNDEQDGFVPIRSGYDLPRTDSHLDQPQENGFVQSYLEIVMAILTTAAAAPFPSNFGSHEADTINILLDAGDEGFLLLVPIYLYHLKQGTCVLQPSEMEPFFARFEPMLINYTYSRHEPLQLLVIDFLDSTSHLWTDPLVSITEAGRQARVLCHWFAKVLMNGKIHSWRIRDRFAVFLDQYLSQDPLQTIWAMPSQAEDEEDEGEPHPDAFPDKLLIRLGNDEDMRVRFRAAFYSARLVSVFAGTGQDMLSLYAEIRENLSKDIDNFEAMLSRVLCLGNIMVSASSIRRGPYWHLLETAFHRSHYSAHLTEVLSAVSKRMGLTRLADLFEAYSFQLAFSVIQSGYNILSFPPKLLGYTSLKELAEATFLPFTPINLISEELPSSVVAERKALFKGHCQALSKSLGDGISDCFADIIAHKLTSWADKQASSGSAHNRFKATLRYDIMSLDPSASFDEMLKTHASDIIFLVLRSLGDMDFRAGGAIVQALEVSDPKKVAPQMFRSLTQTRDADEFQPYEPNLPKYSTHTIICALHWLFKQEPAARSPATTYHVLHRFFWSIQASVLVNEQMRLLNALALWISLRNTDFKTQVLLRVLMNGAVTLLGQEDLVFCAQGLLDWSFTLYSTLVADDTSFPSIFIRAGTIAQAYSINPDIKLQTIGASLKAWIEEKALLLYRNPRTGQQLERTILPLWPYETDGELMTLCKTLSANDISQALGQSRPLPNKFSTAKKLIALAGIDYDGLRFSQFDFWNLKASIPSHGQLNQDDVNAFISLLLTFEGQFEALASDNSISVSIRGEHQRIWRMQNGSASFESLTQPPVITSLVASLETREAASLSATFHALRSLALLMSKDAFGSQSWTSDQKQELLYLQAFNYPTLERTPRELKELEDLATSIADFGVWITQLAVFLIDVLVKDDSFFGPLAPLLGTDVALAEDFLPVLVHSVLYLHHCQGKSKGQLAKRLLSDYLNRVIRSEIIDDRCSRSIIDTVLHLRNFYPPGASDALAYNAWLDVDFKYLGLISVKCGAYTTALLFLELDVENPKTHSENARSTLVSNEQMLYEIYSHIEEPDGFYGIEAGNLRQFLVKRFHHEQQWDKAFRFHGAALEASDNQAPHMAGIVTSLHSFGFNQMAVSITQREISPTSPNHSSATLSYDLAWRTQNWDLPVVPGSSQSGLYLYQALRAIARERDECVIDSTIHKSLSMEIERLRQLGNENVAEIKEVVKELMSLHQVAQWLTLSHSHSSSQELAKPWQGLPQIGSSFEFIQLEAIMATRIALIRIARQKEKHDQLGDMMSPVAQELAQIEEDCLIRLSSAARDSQNHQIALNAVTQAQMLNNVPKVNVEVEFAQVLWALDERKAAIQSLKSIIMTDSETSPSRIENKVTLLARLGTWVAEACLEKPTDISSNYFELAVSLLVDENGYTKISSKASSVFYQYAVFAESQYQAISKSPDTIRYKLYIERKMRELRHRREQMSRTSAGSQSMQALAKEQQKAHNLLKEDQEKFQEHNRAMLVFREQAIDMFSRCLEAGDEHDSDAAMRFCSLWLSNFEDESFQPKIKIAIVRIASRKMVFLSRQLSARMLKEESVLSLGQDTLRSLILRICREHPFHGLYHVYPLQPAREVSHRRSLQRFDLQSSQAGRGAAAADIFAILREDNSVKARVLELEHLCDAALQWANHPIKKGLGANKRNNGPYDVPENLLIRKLSDLQVPVSTVHTPIDPTLRYDNCVWLTRYEATFSTAGGVNLPKISVCIGSDGQKYKQLFKGEGGDDLRQDAVMEQVFEQVNTVLNRDHATRKRRLHVRGYKVIPLAPQAGLLEFVENTTPLQAWLIPAHARYHPQDLKPADVNASLRAKQESRPPPEAMNTLFTDLCKRFRPAMRHYFTEKHKVPAAWFEMRLNYTRSVATTSVAGHIIGLGDRHTSNILIDNSSGEVIHIDLGIAFEQGKLLPIPERVPFRLTRDMVDGMGVSGTQGVFQRCAEETLRVLRDGSATILTVLEVLRHDPLHSWTANDIRVRRVQGAGGHGRGPVVQTGTIRDLLGIDLTSDGSEEAADRALSTVQRKLDRALSVEYTINELIAEATDTMRLANMFAGWGPQY